MYLRPHDCRRIFVALSSWAQAFSLPGLCFPVKSPGQLFALHILCFTLFVSPAFCPGFFQGATRRFPANFHRTFIVGISLKSTRVALLCQIVPTTLHFMRLLPITILPRETPTPNTPSHDITSTWAGIEPPLWFEQTRSDVFSRIFLLSGRQVCSLSNLPLPVKSGAMKARDRTKRRTWLWGIGSVLMYVPQHRLATGLVIIHWKVSFVKSI